MSRVGNIYKLKCECLGNEKGTEGICFNDYGDGFQVIFPNGNYDGFSTVCSMGPVRKMKNGEQVEANYFLEYTGLDPSSADYEFKNVIQVEKDFRNGRWFK